MSELTIDEFVTELLMRLEEHLEGWLTPKEKGELRDLLRRVIVRLDGEELAA